jgi:hypothetical protein
MKFDRVRSQKAAVFCGQTKLVIQDSVAWIPERDTKGWKALVRSELFTWSALSTLPRIYVRSVNGYDAPAWDAMRVPSSPRP